MKTILHILGITFIALGTAAAVRAAAQAILEKGEGRDA